EPMMTQTSCPDCEPSESYSRREFVRVLGSSAAAAAAAGALTGGAFAEGQAKPASETVVKQLYDLLTPAQKEEICFPWDYTDDRGLLRTRVSNNWSITDVTKLNVGGSFFSQDQQELIREIFLGLYNADWHERIFKQLGDEPDA